MVPQASSGARLGVREIVVSEVKVATRFSRHLGGRYKADGPWSGEAFRDSVLLDGLEQALKTKKPLVINFDGVAGTPTSFLEEAFGGIFRVRPQWTLAQVKPLLKLEAPNSPFLQSFMALAYQFMDREAQRRLQ